ncbi:IF44L protein, partial [Polypterus senegalus]
MDWRAIQGGLLLWGICTGGDAHPYPHWSQFRITHRHETHQTWEENLHGHRESGALGLSTKFVQVNEEGGSAFECIIMVEPTDFQARRSRFQCWADVVNSHSPLTPEKPAKANNVKELVTRLNQKLIITEADQKDKPKEKCSPSAMTPPVPVSAPAEPLDREKMTADTFQQIKSLWESTLSHTLKPPGAPLPKPRGLIKPVPRTKEMKAHPPLLPPVLLPSLSAPLTPDTQAEDASLSPGIPVLRSFSEDSGTYEERTNSMYELSEEMGGLRQAGEYSAHRDANADHVGFPSDFAPFADALFPADDSHDASSQTDSAMETQRFDPSIYENISHTLYDDVNEMDVHKAIGLHQPRKPKNLVPIAGCYGENANEKEKKKREKELRQREKKESDIRRRFHVTGLEEPIHIAQVLEGTKGGRNELQVWAGDSVDIIRTEECPSGKWLVRDGSGHYGYVPISILKLDPKEILASGRRGSASITTSTPKHGTSWQMNSVRDKLLDEIRNYQTMIKSVAEPRILLIGQIGCGKSSFFNSVNSIFRGYVIRQATAGFGENSVSKLYRTYPIHDGRGGKKVPFILCDTMGLEGSSDEAGIHVDDIISVINGHVPDQYEFNPKVPISDKFKCYREKPSLADKVYCIVYVVEASKVSLISEVLLKKFKFIQSNVNNMGIPQLLMVTKIDDACTEVAKDLTKVYQSRYIYEKVTQLAQVLGVPPSAISLVKNYAVDFELNLNMDVLILTALQQMLRAVDACLDEMKQRGLIKEGSS